MRAHGFQLVVILLLVSYFAKKSRAELPRHKLLLLSIDGFRWDFAEKRNDLEAFDYLKRNGVSAKFLRPPFPSLTSPSHYTIATGLYPESHGVIHNSNFNITSGEYAPDFFAGVIVNYWWDADGIEPIWITAVKQGLKSGGYLFPGSSSTVGGVRATKSRLIDSNTPITEEAVKRQTDEAMSWFTQDNLDMVALYISEPDTSLHRVGPDSPTVTDELIPLINRHLLYLFDSIHRNGLTDKLNVIILSDHGFEQIDQSVTEHEAISLASYVNRSHLSFMFVGGPIAFIEPLPGFVEIVADALKNGNDKMDVYLKKDIPDRYHLKNSERVTSIVVVAHPGHLLYEHFPGHHYGGYHGYDNDAENMRGIYYSIGPSFKKNYRVEGFDSVHIYSLMCHLLGLEPAPNNGSLDALRETLQPVVGRNDNSHHHHALSWLFVDTSLFELMLMSSVLAAAVLAILTACGE